MGRALQIARYVLLAALGAAFPLLLPATRHGGWYLGNILMIGMWFFLIVPVHELGHALAARASGMRVFEVAIGRGPLVFAARVAGTRVSLRLWPTSGVTFAATRDPSRGRLLFYISGGVLANVLLALVAVVVAGGFGALARPLDLAPEPAVMLVWANVFVIIPNVLPGLVMTPAGPVRTDGLQAWSCLAWRPEQARAARVAWPILEARQAKAAGQLTRAVDILTTAADELGPAWQIDAELATLHLQRGDVRAARARYAAILDAAPADLAPGLKPAIENNLAYTIALDPEATDAALADARRRTTTLATRRAAAFYHGTHGAVLARLGEGAQAEPFLETGLRGAESDGHRAANAAWLALACAGVGDALAAHGWLGRARAWAPESYEIKLVERLMEKAPPIG